MSKKTLLIVIAIAFVVTLFSIIYFISTIDFSLIAHRKPIDDPAVKDTIRFEILKNLLELCLIVIAGGFIAYLFKSREEAIKDAAIENERARNKHQANTEIRLNYFSRLGNIYRTVKLVRRTLSANGLTSQFENQQPQKIEGDLADLYLSQMELLNKSQLELEGLKIEANSLPALVKLTIINSSLLGMEDYLRRILKEYECVCPSLKEGKSLNLSDLNRLDEFTSEPERNFIFPKSGSTDKKEIERENYRFKKDFSTPYSNVINAIGMELSETTETSMVARLISVSQKKSAT